MATPISFSLAGSATLGFNGLNMAATVALNNYGLNASGAVGVAGTTVSIALGGYSWGTPDGVSGEGELARVGPHAVADGHSTLNLVGPLFASV